MARTRLYRSIVVFGTSLGFGAPMVAVALTPACDLYFEPSGGHDPTPDAHWGCIGDAPLPDAWHGIIDAALPPDAWPTIADAPTFDAPPHAVKS